jgi:endonuclease III
MAIAQDARRHARQIARRLARQYPDAQCALSFTSPLELLIATILSAQCTDQRVNIVTPVLFKRYPTANDLAKAPQSDIEQIIQSTGFFRNKAKSIKECCKALVESHAGKVPQDMESMVHLAGVGRKTANVVLGTAFGIPSGVVVDTHVGRLSIRLGLTRETDPLKVERDLMQLLPKREWIAFAHRMIHHGRRICTARNPQCEICPLNDICPKIGVEKPKLKSVSKRPAKTP